MYRSVQLKNKKPNRPRRKMILNKSQANYLRFSKNMRKTKQKKKKLKKNLKTLKIPENSTEAVECDKTSDQSDSEKIVKRTRNSLKKLGESNLDYKIKNKHITGEGSSALCSSPLTEEKCFSDKIEENYKSSEVFVIDLDEKCLNAESDQESDGIPTERNNQMNLSPVLDKLPVASKRGAKRVNSSLLESTSVLETDKEENLKSISGLKKNSKEAKNKRTKSSFNSVFVSFSKSYMENEENVSNPDHSTPLADSIPGVTDEDIEEQVTSASDLENTYDNEISDTEIFKPGFDDTFEEAEENRSGISDEIEKNILPEDDYNNEYPSAIENYGRRSLFCLNGKLLLLLEHPNVVGIRGHVTLQVLYGCVVISGLVLEETSSPQHIISANSQSAPTIKTSQATKRSKSSDELTKELIKLEMNPRQLKEVEDFLDNECSLVLFREYKHPVTKCLSSYVPNLFQYNERKVLQSDQSWCNFVDPEERTSLNIPKDWYQVADVFCQLAGNFKVSNDENQAAMGMSETFSSSKNHSNKGVRNLRILVCGGKNCGKSTFLRFLANSILSVTNDVLYYLDGDPGQSEFTVPGCVSIAEINEPILGPSFSHHRKLIKSHFVGGITVHTMPDLYSRSMKSLADYIKTEACFNGKPLLINTMGWTSGMGRALLLDAVRFLQPMFVIQINQLERENFKETEFFTTEFLERQPGWLTNIETSISDLDLLVLETVQRLKRSQFTAAELRNLAIISYFAQLYKTCDLSQPLHGFTPYRVPWSSVGVHVCHEYVPNHQILHSLNCSIVALCICDPSELKTSSDYTLPKFLLSVPICNCIGFGIIRGIDMIEKEFYVLTPVEFEDLKNVNLFLKGSLAIPEQIILNQNNEGGLPYVTETPFAQTVVGGRTTRRRTLYNVKSARD